MITCKSWAVRLKVLLPHNATFQTQRDLKAQLLLSPSNVMQHPNLSLAVFQQLVKFLLIALGTR